jgi:tetratricopeptide (TPR) repeat protein
MDGGKIEAIHIEFQLGFLEDAHLRHPDNVEVLVDLGELYTRTGRYREGLEIDRRLVKVIPDNATVHYNLACSLALLGQNEGAIKALRKALRRGFNDFKHLKEDPDLAGMRGDPEFEALLEMAPETL